MYNTSMERLELIQNYQPTREIIDLVDATPLVIFCGITGAGKDAVQDGLHKLRSFQSLVTSTTRPPRDEHGVMERDGVEYYFLSDDQALENLKNRAYFEVANVHGKTNGVLAKEIHRIYDTGETAIFDIDYQGVDYFQRYAPSTKAIFLIPPSFDVWMKRLKSRYDTEEDFQAAWPKRRESAVRELQWAVDNPRIVILVNDDLDEVVRQSLAVIDGQEVDQSTGRALTRDILESLKQEG